jgi:hypothetical protein
MTHPRRSAPGWSRTGWRPRRQSLQQMTRRDGDECVVSVVRDGVGQERGPPQRCRTRQKDRGNWDGVWQQSRRMIETAAQRTRDGLGQVQKAAHRAVVARAELLHWRAEHEGALRSRDTARYAVEHRGDMIRDRLRAQDAGR